MSRDDAVPSNEFLSSLGERTRDAIEVDLREMRFPLRSVLVEPGYATSSVYFPLTAVLCLVTQRGDGEVAENIALGRESLLALPLFEQANGQTKALVLVEGSGFEMSQEAFFRHLAQREDFRLSVMRHRELQLSNVFQSSFCLAFHKIEERLARWLLTMQDRVRRDDLHVTHDFLASMMAVHRPTVTLAAQILQEAGLLDYHYGRIHIRDRVGLEAAACGCYASSDRLILASSGVERVAF